ncbi:MAG: hypothetical protein BWZ01_02827 [Deltaproteobacteria bacterium ADurb.BinA179]|nr:MAG: hypothetical protein BWZ01_02827 [Deltaproteobacteria bacterium ADurb.BinA179]
MQSGASDVADRVLTTSLKVSASSMPGMPTFTSSREAPLIVCSCANFLTRAVRPESSSSWRSFFPVGLMRSPIMTSGPSLSSRIVFRAELRADGTLPVSCTGVMCAALSFSARICSGVVPQQPPRKTAPDAANSPANPENSSGAMGNTAFPSRNTGSPAFGFATRGTFAYGAIALTNGSIPSGPMEQLHPTASAPRD